MKKQYKKLDVTVYNITTLNILANSDESVASGGENTEEDVHAESKKIYDDFDDEEE